MFSPSAVQPSSGINVVMISAC